MSAPQRLLLVVGIAAILGLLFWFLRPSPDVRAPVDQPAAAAGGAEAPPAAATTPPASLPGLRGLPAEATSVVPGPAEATPGSAAADAPVGLALPPTPPDEGALRAALADPAQPVAFSYMRFLVDRYLMRQPPDAPLPPDAPVDEVFPPELRSRLRLPPGARLAAVEGQPVGLPGALDQAFRPRPGATWKVKLEFHLPESGHTQRELELHH